MLTLSQIAEKHGLCRSRLESFARRNHVRPAGFIKPPMRRKTSVFREEDFLDYIKDARPDRQAVISLYVAISADQRTRLNRMREATGKNISTYARQAIERQLDAGGW